MSTEWRTDCSSSVKCRHQAADRLFQRRLPATGNARSPTVGHRVRRITRCEDDSGPPGTSDH